jgi:hypothetical protein
MRPDSGREGVRAERDKERAPDAADSITTATGGRALPRIAATSRDVTDPFATACSISLVSSVMTKWNLWFLAISMIDPVSEFALTECGFMTASSEFRNHSENGEWKCSSPMRLTKQNIEITTLNAMILHYDFNLGVPL